VYARSTTITAQPESIDAGIAQVRDEVMPAIQQTEGCVGLSLLVDRGSGRCIATSAWQSKEAMRATEDQLRPLRERVAERMGGTLSVEEWEIAVLHRDHQSADGACVRVTWTQVDPADVDRAIDVYKMTTLPAMEELEGFCSASLFVDRESGRGVSSVTFDSLDAMTRNRQAAAAIRETAVREAGAEVLDIGEFELALAHLRVPEMT
jgi:quinol monooxygenase YgiN